MDLDNICSSYRSRGKILRLLFIAFNSPNELQSEALALCLEAVKNETTDVCLYQSILQHCNELHLNIPADNTWFDTTVAKNAAMLVELENELRLFKENMIKDSIRLTNVDMAEAHYLIGDSSTALKCLLRAKDYCSSSAHILELYYEIMKNTMATKDSSAAVISHFHKATSSFNLSFLADNPSLAAKINVMRSWYAVSEMCIGNYKAAAQAFFNSRLDLDQKQFDFVSANDIATYGALCALASYDRSELLTVIKDPLLQNYFEGDIEMRDLIVAFYNCQFVDVLDKLAEKMKCFMLDMYLNGCIEHIVKEMRLRGIYMYAIPYFHIDLQIMAREFKASVDDLEEELIGLLQSGKLAGRIDSFRKVLHMFSAQQSLASPTGILNTAMATFEQLELKHKECIVKVEGNGE